MMSITVTVIMGRIASQITSLMIVYSIVYWDADQRKKSKLRVTGLCAGIHRRPVNSPHKWPVTLKMFPIDDVIMYLAITAGPGGWYDDKPQRREWHHGNFWFSLSIHSFTITHYSMIFCCFDCIQNLELTSNNVAFLLTSVLKRTCRLKIGKRVGAKDCETPANFKVIGIY